LDRISDHVSPKLISEVLKLHLDSDVAGFDLHSCSSPPTGEMLFSQAVDPTETAKFFGLSVTRLLATGHRLPWSASSGTIVFYSVDIIQRRDGQLRVVEIGDGQVCDLVGWTPDELARMLTGFNRTS
jgi:hypothetical protein